MNKIKAIIFDMDGVLIDSESICDKTWEIAAAEFGISNSQEAINRCRGTNSADATVILKEIYGQDFDTQAFTQRTSQLFHQIEDSEGIPLMPFAKEALDSLKNKYRLALASSTRFASVQRLLSKHSLLSYFETFTTGDMVAHSKPHPEIYQLACQSLNLTPQECIAVEDSPNGIKSAVAAGLKTIMIPDTIAPTPELQSLTWKIYDNLSEMCQNL